MTKRLQFSLALMACLPALGTDVQEEVARLRAQMALQQAQLEQLQRSLADQRQALDRLTAPSAAPATAEVPSKSPLTWSIGDTSFTPQGFLDVGIVMRNRTTGTGFPTNFGAIAYGDTVNGNLRERQLSVQNSRLGFRLDSRVFGMRLTGLMEADFLGYVPGNSAVTSNSDGLRLRLYWVDIRKGHWEGLAGQSWSLLTPNKQGLSPLPSDLFLTQDVDPNYHVGQVWGRTPQVRGVYHANEHVAVGVSLESADQYGGGSAGGGVITLPSQLASSYASQLNMGSGGVGVPTAHQDLIGKLALDQAVNGRAYHVEIAGVLREFNFYNQFTGQKFHAVGGGGSVNANLELFRNFRLVANNFASSGGGRWIFGQGPDLVIRGDGSPSLVNSFATIDGFEYQMKPKFLLYSYYGGTYIKRNSTIDPATGLPVGYGYVGSPDSQNRSIQQVTGGFNYTIWRNPDYGAMQFMTQYSYFMRNPWFVAPGRPVSAGLNALYLNFRFTLPGQPPAR